MPGGETLAQVGARADRVIERALAAGRRHARVRPLAPAARRSAARWIGIGPEGGGKLVLGTAALCVLGFERERRVLKRWNWT